MFCNLKTKYWFSNCNSMQLHQNWNIYLTSFADFSLIHSVHTSLWTVCSGKCTKIPDSHIKIFSLFISCYSLLSFILIELIKWRERSEIDNMRRRIADWQLFPVTVNWKIKRKCKNFHGFPGNEPCTLETFSAPCLLISCF